MTALPPKTSFTDVTVTKGSFKVALDNLRDYLSGLLGSDGVAATARAALGVAVQAALSPAVRGSPIINGYVTASVGGSPSQLIIALKTNAGVDPSAADPVYVVLPKNSASSAAPNFVAITAATTLVLPSGASLGHQAGILQHLFIYGVYDDGSPGGFELAVSNIPPDYPGFAGVRLTNTTAISSGSNSASGLYSTTARSNVSWVALAMGKSTQTVAGSWDAALSQLDPAPFRIPRNQFRAYQSIATSFVNNTQTKAAFDTKEHDIDSVFSTANKRFQPNVAGYYNIRHLNGPQNTSSQTQGIIYIFKNGVTHSQLDFMFIGTAGAQAEEIEASVLMNGTSDYIEGYFYQSSGGALNSLAGSGGDNYLEGERTAVTP